mmetsp:Transcript_61937/g.86118  ORF Transcript_61937/g.86118 Transcript_61937/m.86118 type:complete len:210 (+) Transcript_61937:105-734(+)
MWGSKPADPKQIVKDSKQQFRQGNRDIDKEIRAIERDEAKLTAQIKRTAKSGDHKGAQIQAKSLVKLRQSKERLLATKTRMTGVQMQLKTAATTTTMVDSMKVATKAAASMNKEMERSNVLQNLKEFERANMEMDMKGEMMDDLLDGIFDDPGADAEVDDIIAEVTGGIALEKSAEMNAIGSLPAQKPQSTVLPQAEEEDLLARLAALQ